MRLTSLLGWATVVLALGATGGSAGQETVEGERGVDVVDVREHGAIPDDGNDDTMAVQAALDAARQSRASRVLFPQGRYDFHVGANPAIPNMAVPIHEIHDLSVEGENAEILLHGYLNCFGLGNCRNVAVRGFTIDCAKMPFSQGDVTEVGDDHVDVRVHDNYPVVGGEPVQAVNDYDRETRLRVASGADIYWSVDSTELIAPQTLRLHTAWRFNLDPGALVLLRHQVYGYNAFTVHNSEDVTIGDSTVYMVPGMGVVGHHSRNILVERLKVLRKPGTDRLMSVTADGSHFGGCRGKVTLRECVFEFQGDDAVNAKHGLYLTVLERLDDRTVRAKHNLDMAQPPTVGERLELRSAETVIAFGTARVSAVETEADGFTYRVEFEEPIPAEATPGALLGCFENNAEFLIQDCEFRNNRQRGMLIQVHGATIEGCTFDGCTNAGIYLVSDTVHFYECSPARDVVIRNNRFINCNTQQSSEGVIGVFGWRNDWSELPKPGVFQRIRIEGNRIENTNSGAFYINGADDVQVLNNHITGVCRAPAGDRGKAAICITASRNVRLEGNTARIEDQREGCARILSVSDTAERDTIEVAGNVGF